MNEQSPKGMRAALQEGDCVEYWRGFGRVVRLVTTHHVIVEHETGLRERVHMMACMYLPSADDIRRQCKLIQASWSDNTLRQQLGLPIKHMHWRKETGITPRALQPVSFRTLRRQAEHSDY